MQIVYTTCPDAAVAKTLSHGLLEAHLIACANMMEGMTSFYRWEESMCEESEVVLVLKTTDAQSQSVMDYLEAHHPYECPCIWTIKPDNCLPAFAEWVEKETS